MKIHYTILLFCLFFIVSCKKDFIGYSFTSISEPANGGTISPSSGTFEKGQKINLIATPNQGYIFKEWKGDLVSTLNPEIVFVTQNTTITGLFENISNKSYLVNVDNVVGGTVSIQTGTYKGGTELELVAIPNENYHFLGFEGFPEFKNNIKITVKDNFSIKANFVIKHNGVKKRNPYWFKESDLDYLASENYIVWWDNKFNTLPKAYYLLKEFEELLSICKANGWGVPYSKKYPNLNGNNHLMSLYMYEEGNESDIIWKSGHARCCGTGGNELEGMPYSGWSSGIIEKDNSGNYAVGKGNKSLIFHEGFHMMQFSMPLNTNGTDIFGYSGDSSWWTESTARWFERTYGIVGWTDWYGVYNSLCTQYLQPQVSLWRHNNAKEWSYGMNGYEKGEFFRFLIQYNYVPSNFVFNMAYSKSTLTPQKYLNEKIPNFKKVFGEYAAKFASGIMYNDKEFDAAKNSIQWWLTNACSVNINCNKATNQSYSNQFVTVIGDDGTSGYFTPVEKNEAWSWTVVRIKTNTAKTFNIDFLPEKYGSEKTLSVFNLFLANRDNNIFENVPYNGKINVEPGKDYYLVIVNTPDKFEGWETFDYKLNITK